MRKITPCLWFDHNADEAVKFYISVFQDAKMGAVTYYSEEGAAASGKPVGSVMTISFQIGEDEFLALNGGPHFSFTPALSLIVNCRNQEEIDGVWASLSADGEKGQCGWIKDKFGVSWQIVPTVLGDMMKDKDAEKIHRVMKAVLHMTKLDIQKLEQAYHQG